MKAFGAAWRSIDTSPPDPDMLIEEAVGRVAPVNINVASGKLGREQIFIENLRRQVYEQYKPAFDEVSQVMEQEKLRRPELAELGLAHETNRFLNWVRLVKAQGEEAWRDAPARSQSDRRSLILELGLEWRTVSDHRIPADYQERLTTLRSSLADEPTILNATADQLAQALISLHAFSEQLRFVRGGLPALSPAFWNENNNDVSRVSRSLAYFLYGSGDFVQRLHDLLYDGRWKLNLFGLFCALELFGSIHPDDYPPMNGRMAKSLRYLGFEVKAN
ncbi:MAG: hypothetical protein WDN76_08140 [Alphaproteobacteria bacterium]